MDLAPQSYPPQEDTDDTVQAAPGRAPVVAPESPDVQTQAERPSAIVPSPDQAEIVTSPGEPNADIQPPQQGDTSGPAEADIPTEVGKPDSTAESTSASSYGPVRRRVTGKDGPMTLWRPAALNQEDFVDVMREVELVEDVIMSRDKRPRSPEAASSEPEAPADAVIEVTGNVYGQNDAPAAWFKEFSCFVKTIGRRQSVLDPCLFTLRDPRSEALVGIMGVHVDDTAVGGTGAMFEESIRQLKHRFPYRKWRITEGEFCGAWYKQDPSKAIHMTMKAFADKIRPINIPKGSPPDRLLDASQIKVLRAVNGSLNWLSSQSRPDLSVQTSLSQQAFPRPTISDFRMANQAIRRAKQHGDLGIVFAPIDPQELMIVCNGDAAFANRGNHTQAGYILGFTQRKLQDVARERRGSLVSSRLAKLQIEPCSEQHLGR